MGEDRIASLGDYVQLELIARLYAGPVASFRNLSMV